MADTVDASIPLAGANIAAAGEQSMISAFNFATQLQDYQRQQKAQNALKQLFTDPNSVDPTTGLPTTKAVATIMKIDPEMGMKLSDEMITLNVNKLKERASQSEQGLTAFNYSTKVAGIVTGVYDDTLASTGDPAKAAEAARNERNDLFKNNGGILSDDEADRGIAAPFDINVARRLQEASPDYVKTAKTLEQINAERASMGLPPLTSLSGATSPSTATTPTPPGKPVTLAEATSRFPGPESGGDSTAVPLDASGKPRSSAEGVDQFIDSTWLKEMKTHRPDLTKGKTDAEILAMRTGPDGDKLSAEMSADYAKENADDLKSKNLPVTSGTLYLAHHFGAGGAEAVLTAPPNTPAASVLGPEVVKANPYIAKLTAAQLVQNVTSKVGNNPIEGYEATGAPTPLGGAAPATSNLPDPSTPEGKAMMHGKGWTPVQDSDGTVYRYNANRGLSTNEAGTEWYTPKSMAHIGGPGSGDAFTPPMAALMAALASEGVSLPTGFRSKQQQIALYKGLLDRYPDKTPDEIATAIKLGQIEFAAQKKETQTAATIAGKVTVAANELDEFIPLVEKASKNLPRGSFIPINKLLQMGETKISDPRLVTLRVQLNTLMNAYDLLASRGGEDVAKRAHARSLLTEAQSPEALQAGLDAFKQESLAAKRAAFRATKVPELEDASGGGDKPAKKAAPSTPQKVIAVSTKEEFDALPSGAWYSKPGDPPGKHRVKT